MRETVLIVEDEFLIALELREMFEARGWEVIGPAARVAEALALLEGEMPSFAVLDVNVAGEMVTPVAELLKKRGVPFVVASAYALPERFGGAVLSGVPNAGKPTDEDRVFAALDLARSRPADSR